MSVRVRVFVLFLLRACDFVIGLRTNLEEARVQKDQLRIENKTTENKNREIAAWGVAGFKVRSKIEGGVLIFSARAAKV